MAIRTIALRVALLAGLYWCRLVEIFKPLDLGLSLELITAQLFCQPVMPSQISLISSTVLPFHLQLRSH